MDKKPKNVFLRVAQMDVCSGIRLWEAIAVVVGVSSFALYIYPAFKSAENKHSAIIVSKSAQPS